MINSVRLASFTKNFGSTTAKPFGKASRSVIKRAQRSAKLRLRHGFAVEKLKYQFPYGRILCLRMQRLRSTVWERLAIVHRLLRALPFREISALARACASS